MKRIYTWRRLRGEEGDPATCVQMQQGILAGVAATMLALSDGQG